MVPIALGVVCVLAFWFAIAIALALFIGRAARIGEEKHRDAVFLRSAGEQRVVTHAR